MPNERLRASPTSIRMAVLAALLVSCVPQGEAPDLRVFAAASTRNVLELAQSTCDMPITFQFAGSQTLKLQLQQGQNNTFLGHKAGRGTAPSGNVTTGSNIVCLGDNSVSDLYCADTSISSSDSRDKTDISDFTKGLGWIKALRPITYRWDKRSWYGTDENPMGTPDGSKKRTKLHIGFLAQEALEVEKANGYGSSKDDMLIVNLNEDNSAYGMKYERLVPVLVNAIKELSAEVEQLKSQLNN